MDVNNRDPFTDLSSHNPLFDRLDRDMKAVRQRFSAFEDALASLRNGWLAISLCYDVLKEEARLREEKEKKHSNLP